MKTTTLKIKILTAQRCSITVSSSLGYHWGQPSDCWNFYSLLSLLGEGFFHRLKIFVPAGGDDGTATESVLSSLEAELQKTVAATRHYTVHTGFRLSALFSPEFIENFVKAGQVTVYTAVEDSGEQANLVNVTATGDNQLLRENELNFLGWDGAQILSKDIFD